MYLRQTVFHAVGLALLSFAATAEGSEARTPPDVTRICAEAPAWTGDTYIVHGSVDLAVGDVLQAVQNAFPRAKMRVYAPAELMALTGFSPLVLRNLLSTWLVVMPLDDGGSLLWVRLAGNQTGLTLRYGIIYRSRFAYYRASLHRAVAGVLPARWLPQGLVLRNALPFSTGNAQILRDDYTFDMPLLGGLIR